VASDGEEIDDLIAAYEQTALRWGELQSDASAANKIFEENHSIYKRLRNNEAGRRGYHVTDDP
jgi:hypothetical protein